MKINTIVRPPSLVEKVSDHLAGLIRSGANEGGSLPTVQALMDQMGVSRSVVREAVKKLEMQGLLEVRQGVGMKSVDHLHKPLTSAVELLVPEEKERLRQLVQVRGMMEPENACLAAIHATEAQRQELQATHARLVDAKDLKSAIAADKAFHQGVAAASGNQIAALMMDSLADLLTASLSRGYSRVSTESAIVEHGHILEAILERNAGAARDRMRRHLHTTLDELALPPKSPRPTKAALPGRHPPSRPR